MVLVWVDVQPNLSETWSPAFLVDRQDAKRLRINEPELGLSWLDAGIKRLVERIEIVERCGKLSRTLFRVLF